MDFDRIDIYETLQPLVGPAGWYWRAEDGKLATAVKTMKTRTPWVYLYSRQGLCGIWQDIIFKRFGLLPSHCLECWKVVVRPRNVMHLFRLHDLMRDFLKRDSKCGVEPRDEVAASYGAYFYNGSLGEGRDTWGVVRASVSEMLGEDTPVILKRGCTEFEMRFGPSDGWAFDRAQFDFEQRVLKKIEFPPDLAPQPEDLIQHIQNRWLRFAHSRGDMSYLEKTGGVPLFPDYVTYHGETTGKE